jgi:hypothetical protein
MVSSAPAEPDIRSLAQMGPGQIFAFVNCQLVASHVERYRGAKRGGAACPLGAPGVAGVGRSKGLVCSIGEVERVDAP